jgi:WD40 repeat protein
MYLRYRGHVSVKTIKDVTFVGPTQSMVAAGSDDGRMFIWDRYTGGAQQPLHSIEQWCDRRVV